MKVDGDVWIRRTRKSSQEPTGSIADLLLFCVEVVGHDALIRRGDL